MIVYVVSFAGGVSGIEWSPLAQAVEERYAECLTDKDTYGDPVLFTAVLPDSLDTAADNDKITEMIDAYIWASDQPIPHLSTQVIA